MSSDAHSYDINQHYHPKKDEGECGPYKEKSALFSITDAMFNLVDKPVTWFRKRIVEPNQTKYPWYHEELRRVPTIDKCYVDDPVCIYEADMQYRRDREIDNEILNILRYRMDDCVREEYPDYEKCFPLKEAYEAAAGAWFTKYGDLGAIHNVRSAYIKQKHRLLWERRHGKVGTGMRNKDNETCAEPE